MDRERPDYLPPLKRGRSSFPWLAVIGLALGAAMIGGVGIYLKTVVAWNARHHPTAVSTPPKVEYAPPPMTAEQLAARRAEDEEIVRQFHLQQEKRKRWKCIDGTPFERTRDGGWQNVPNERC